MTEGDYIAFKGNATSEDYFASLFFTDLVHSETNNQAATDYFKSATSTQLYNAFSPKIKLSLDQVGATKAWTDVTTAVARLFRATFRLLSHGFLAVCY